MRRPRKLPKRIALLRAPFKFFFEHAGYCVGKRAAGALSLARAERGADKKGIEFVMLPDDSPDDSFVDSWSERERADWRKQDHKCIGVIAMLPCADHGTDCKHAKHLASLWGIWDADASYLRVIRAELASEALESL